MLGNHHGQRHQQGTDRHNRAGRWRRGKRLGRWYIVGGLVAWWLCSGIWAARASLAAETALVIDGDVGPSFQGALFAVDLSTGQRTLLSDFSNVGQGPRGASPFGVALTADGTVLVIDADAGTESQGGLFMVDPDTGQRTLLSDFGVAGQGPLGENPVGVALTADGGILVVDYDAGTDTQGALFTVDPDTGQRTLLSDFGVAGQGPLGEDPVGVALTIDGTILVSDPNAGVGARGRLFIVNPLTGTRLLLSEFSDAGQGPQGRNPFHLALTADGMILVSDADAGTGLLGGLFSVDPDTGQRTLLSDFGVASQGPLGRTPFGVTTVLNCGNGEQEPGEQCDDGNRLDGDGCSATCHVETTGCGNGTVDAGEDCDLGEGVNGTAGVCCTASCTFVLTGTQCRAAAGQCDAAESCTGTSTSCPTDSFQPPTTVCRVAVGQCDATESCTGTSAACLADGFQPNGTTCDDGNSATSGDVCNTGVCAGVSTLLTVLSPIGGEVWPIGSSQTVRWNPAGVRGKVKIELARDGGATWALLVNNTPNDGAHPWTVTGPTTSQTRVRISSMTTPSIAATSNVVFTISGGSVTVITPNGGESWAIGGKQTIQWNSSNLSGKVKIELSRDGGTTWTLLSNNETNTGNKTWKVTKPATTQARIRVSGISDTGAVDTSNANFTIQ